MKKLLAIPFFTFTFSLFIPLCNAQYKVIYNFNSPHLDLRGKNPFGALTPSVTGDTLYGMTSGGGKYGDGIIFYSSDHSIKFDTLLCFNGKNGATPYGSLTLSGKVLYGMTSAGGTYGDGVVFSIHTDGTGYTVLYNFGLGAAWGNWGNEPEGSLVLSNGVLFGMTFKGGKNPSYGNIFRINTDGTHFDTLHSFGVTLNDGMQPQGSLTLSGNVLYGMTWEGGQRGGGQIFSIDTNGTAYDTLHNFGTFTDDGTYPEADLTLSGNILYGVTEEGGKFSDGTVFSIHTDGSAYDTMHSFAGYPSDGGTPHCDLALLGNTLYGTNIAGGQNGYGTIFSIHTDGTAYDTLHNFGVGNDGQTPYGSITYDNDTLYGMTTAGGVLGTGTIFSYAICPMFVIASQDSTPDNGSGNGSAAVNATGGPSPYTYSWAPGGQTTDSITGLSAGTYTCTVYNTIGCSQTTIITVKSTVGINNISSSSSNISVYPNPSSGLFTMQSSVFGGPWAIEVYNLLGLKVYSQLSTFNSQFLIDLSGQPDGIYLYRVIANSGNILGEVKLVVEK